MCFNQLNHYTADSPSITMKTSFYVYTLLHWKILSQLINGDGEEYITAYHPPPPYQQSAGAITKFSQHLNGYSCEDNKVNKISSTPLAS